MALPGVKKVAVIGGGPSGMAVAKYLLAEKHFTSLTVYEQRSMPGGVWNATPDAPVPVSFTVPSTHPSTSPELPIPSSSNMAAPEFFSPVYPSLTTNIPHGLMEYSKFQFPNNEAIPLFPGHTTVLKYLQSYADQVRDLVKYSMQVVDVHPLATPSSGWSVTAKHTVSGVEETRSWDAVILANGHFNDVFVPEIQGLKEWKGLVSHSKFFKGAEMYKGQKVLLIGNGASGTDLSDHLAPFCSSLLVSAHNSSKMPQIFDNITELPEIAFFDQSKHSVHFSNGAVKTDIDAVIFCTGYLYSFPFLHLPTSYPPAITNGERVQGTYQHIFYTIDPTLSFVGLPQRIIPFPDAESQAAVIARMYSARLTLPGLTEMRSWEEERCKLKGDGRAFHCMPFPEDVENMNDLYDWAAKAEKNNSLEGDGTGLLPKWWDAEAYWIRERVPALKGAVRKLNVKGTGWKITRMKDLGFDFNGWKRDETEVEKNVL